MTKMASSNRSACSLPARLMLLLVLAAGCLQASASVAAGSPTAASARRALQEAAAAAQASSREWADKLDNSYLSNAELGLWMNEYVQRCAPLARRFSIGVSAVDKTPLYVLEISDNPGVQEPEPNFKYVANMHGDETSGRALLSLLAEWLCEQYQKDERATRIVRDMHLFIMPTMNPDGFARGQRNNGQDIDLNRNFPDPQYSCQPGLAGCLPSSLLRTMNQSAPEAQAVMRWSLPANARRLLRRSSSSSSSIPTPPRNVRSFHFTAAANLHEGAVVANYPFDGAPLQRPNLAAAAAEPVTYITQGAMAAVTAESARHQQQQQQQQQRPSDIGQALEQAAARGGSIPRTSVTPPAAAAALSASSSSSDVGSSSVVLPAGYHGSPDDLTFRFLASSYAKKHSWMSDSTQNPYFSGGITNGAAWYDVYGGMQDWNYLAGSCMDITLELNEIKYPAPSQLPKIWNENKKALIALPLTAALGGIRGIVTSSSDGLAIPASITVDGISWRMFADSYFGFYARPIKPGVYTVRATYPGFRSATAKVTVPEDGSGVVANLVMRPSPSPSP